MFLFVPNEVLRASNHTCILYTLNGLGHGNAGQDWIGTEACRFVSNMNLRKSSLRTNLPNCDLLRGPFPMDLLPVPIAYLHLCRHVPDPWQGRGFS
jgi:hypothetical protein